MFILGLLCGLIVGIVATSTFAMWSLGAFDGDQRPDDE